MKHRFAVLSLSLVVAACLASRSSFAQETAYQPYHPFTVGAEVGTTGAGGYGAYRFMDHFGAHAGGDYFRYSTTRTIENVSYDATIKLQSEPVTLDLFPSRDSSFHFSVGVVFNQFEGTATGIATGGTFTLNGQTFPAAAVGTLNLDYKQQPVNPYIGVGGNFFYFDSAHQWSFGGEAGVFYTGDAKLNLTRAGGIPSAAIDSALAAEQQTLIHDANKFKVWPVLKLSVNFSF